MPSDCTTMRQEPFWSVLDVLAHYKCTTQWVNSYMGTLKILTAQFKWILCICVAMYVYACGPHIKHMTQSIPNMINFNTHQYLSNISFCQSWLLVFLRVKEWRGFSRYLSVCFSAWMVISMLLGIHYIVWVFFKFLESEFSNL